MKPDVKAFFHQLSGTWSYVATDTAQRQAIIIDPVLDYDAASGRTATHCAQQILDFINDNKLSIDWILETHAHADHISAAQWLAEKLKAKIGIGQGIQQVQKAFKPIFNLEPEFKTDGSQFDYLFRDGEQLKIGALTLTIIATPGHTSDSLSYLIGDALFVGDSLFLPDVGTARCDFPGGDASTLYASIKKLYQLPDTTRVFVCHDYPGAHRTAQYLTSIAEQKAKNIHIKNDTKLEEYVKLRQARDRTLSMPALILPSVQMNIRAGQKPPPEGNGKQYLKIPLDTL